MVGERLDEKSYLVETANGRVYRRNRSHIKKSVENNSDAPARGGGGVLDPCLGIGVPLRV